jgi:hypothetical protein
VNALEAGGKIWVSGPFIEEGILVGDGRTIFSTSMIEGARRAVEGEPLIKRGLRTFEFRKWKLREGRIDISLCTRRSGGIRFDDSARRVIECNKAFEVLLRNQTRRQSSQSEEF